MLILSKIMYAVMFARFVCALLGFRAHEFPDKSKKNWIFIVDHRSYVYTYPYRVWPIRGPPPPPGPEDLAIQPLDQISASARFLRP